jgi:hypothetical protein
MALKQMKWAAFYFLNPTQNRSHELVKTVSVISRLRWVYN